MLTDSSRHEGKRPDVPHLGVMGERNTWIAIPPGAWLMYGDGKKVAVPMLLMAVKPGKGGLKFEAACCGNPKCTRRIRFEGKWIGRHIEEKLI